MIIRKYQPQDFYSVRKICMDTASKNFQSDKRREFIATLFVDYYLHWESENVFVAEENGEVCGYIVCSTNKTLFNQKMKEIYLPKIKKISFFFWVFAKICVKTSWQLDSKLNSGGFHLNVSSKFQGKKIGPKLLNRLGQYLLDEGYSHMYLVTANKKTRGYGFYTHFGFKQFKKCGGNSIALCFNLNDINNNQIKYSNNL